MIGITSSTPEQKSWLHDHRPPRTNPLVHSATSARAPDCSSDNNRFLQAFRDIRNASRSVLSSLVKRCFERIARPYGAENNVIDKSWAPISAEPMLNPIISWPKERPASTAQTTGHVKLDDHDDASHYKHNGDALAAAPVSLPESQPPQAPAEPSLPTLEDPVETKALAIADAVCELIDVALRTPDGARLKQNLRQTYNAFRLIEAQLASCPEPPTSDTTLDDKVERRYFPGYPDKQAWYYPGEQFQV